MTSGNEAFGSGSVVESFPSLSPNTKKKSDVHLVSHVFNYSVSFVLIFFQPHLTKSPAAD